MKKSKKPRLTNADRYLLHYGLDFVDLENHDDNKQHRQVRREVQRLREKLWILFPLGPVPKLKETK